MERNTPQEEISTGMVFRLTGIFTMVFSLAAGLISLLLPSSCSIVGGAQLLLLGALFIFGALAYLGGTILEKRRTR